jgi:hypothetical protein
MARGKCRDSERLDHRTQSGNPEIDNLFSVVNQEAIMQHQVNLLDIVALAEDLPEHNLRRGQVGTVVESLAGGEAFEVEFSDREGRTFESLGLRPHQLIVLRYEPAASP